MKSHDADLMQHADGEVESDELVRDPAARAKVDAIGELGEVVRGHLELHADRVPDRRFDAMWREIEKAIERDAATAPKTTNEPTMVGSSRGKSVWRRLSRWLEQYRGHIITGVVSAGAVAALALVLRGQSQPGTSPGGSNVIPAQAAKYRPTEIEELDTPGGTGTVFNVKDDDGSTTVIWVTPEDTVEGI